MMRKLGPKPRRKLPEPKRRPPQPPGTYWNVGRWKPNDDLTDWNWVPGHWRSPSEDLSKDDLFRNDPNNAWVVGYADKGVEALILLEAIEAIIDFLGKPGRLEEMIKNSSNPVFIAQISEGVKKYCALPKPYSGQKLS